MKYYNIESYDELKKNLKNSERSFLLIYKSESEQSECAFKSMKDIHVDNEDVQLFVVDVRIVRDVHEQYGITSVPTMIEFISDKPGQIIKGCHEPNFFKSIFENSLYSASKKNDDKKAKRVVVYSTTTCHHCTTLKNYLKDHRITFRDIDVGQDQNRAEEMVRKSGQQGVPQIEINGRIVVGFNKPKIDELLEIK